jgi:hypothetical protein
MKRRDLLITGAIVLFGAGVLDTVLSLTSSPSSSSNYQPLTSHYGNKPIASPSMPFAATPYLDRIKRPPGRGTSAQSGRNANSLI